jgi:hypothetical protein
MKRYLAGAAVVGCLFAIGAGTALAKASYDISSQSGFISRGDVIAAGGKGALIANPVITFTQNTWYRLTCTWPDSTQLSTTTQSSLFIQYQPETRYAGNGTITGYFLSRDDEVASQMSPPFDTSRQTCLALRGLPDNGTPIQTDATPLRTTSRLTFFGPAGPFDLDF